MDVNVNLPQYRCHKVVEAMKIAKVAIVDDSPDSKAVLVGELGSEIVVDAKYLEKHEPQVGGYYVRYADGYESWSPAEAFESGYTRLVDGPDGPEPVPLAYAVDPKERARLREVFTYHAPKGDQVRRYAALRAAAYDLAILLAELTPPGRERALALTKLEEAVFFANAAIARGE